MARRRPWPRLSRAFHDRAQAEPTADHRDARGADVPARSRDDELARLRRFGEPRSYRAGEALAQVGEAGPGLMLILSGKVEISQHDERGQRTPHRHPRARQFHGRARPAVGPALRWSTRIALTDVEALAIPPERLRALLVAEAELGERIMRALILRRVGLIEAGGGGPVIVGRDGDADVLRLVNFLRRNGHPVPAARSRKRYAARGP